MTMKSSAVFAIAAASIPMLTAAGPLHTRQNGTGQTMIYDFTDLTPTPELKWTPCYSNFTCALLEVPLDYTDESIGTTHLAIIKLSAQNGSAEDLLINPGGPGGSGVDLVLHNSAEITAKVGLQYNIVGIDPRGVNNSGPDVACFSGYPPAGRNAFYAEAFSVPDYTSPYGLAKNFQTVGAYGDWCTAAYSVNGTARYANTVAVAHDFLHYIELAAQAKGYQSSEAKLNYYGISYGSVLGATFASLFPDRINRMVVDGVVDSEGYYNGAWETAISDTDEALRAFFRSCFEAGPELCAFHQNAASWEELEKRYNAILDALKQSPLPVADYFSEYTTVFTLIPAVVTWQDLVEATFAITYAPVQFPVVATALAELERGNASTLHALKPAARIVSPFDLGTYDARDARTLVSCLDTNGRFNTSTIEEYTEHVELMMNTSHIGGLAITGSIGPICRKLNVFPPESQIFEGAPSANKTSAPILWIGNTADPVTPLRSAHKMAGLFPGSTVLAANVSGHSTFGLASKCIDTYTQQYFLDASLPPSNTVCKVEQEPFSTSVGDGEPGPSITRRWLL